MNIGAAACVAMALLPLASTARAQEAERCSWSANRQANVRNARGQYDTFFGGNVVMRCPAKELTLTSDSVESYADEGRVFVIGNVHYREPRFVVTSDFLTYFQAAERIVATGDVHAELPSGSTLSGPFAEYQRVIPGVRPVPRLVATGRPTIDIVQRDSTGRVLPPLVVIANNVTTVGDSLVYAGGTVIATREDIVARGDSMALDSEQEFLRMMRSPSIEGRQNRPFTLSGTIIDAFSRDRHLARVVARGRARAVSQDLTLASDTIDLRVQDNLLQRAVAWGAIRARASSPTQTITSDSIDVLMPAQRVREMHAVRGAVAESQPDSSRFRPDTVDWLRGDTIIAVFDSSAAGDTSKTPAIRRLFARGSARSFYQLQPADSAELRPAINYVIGREIVVDFDSQQVARVTVYDQKGGVYLEPRRVASAADSASARTPGNAPRPDSPGATPALPSATVVPAERPAPPK